MKVYLDNNTLTKIDPLVMEAMQPLLTEQSGDLHSLHSFSSTARKLYKEAMDKIYASIAASDNDDIVITSSGAESNSMLFMGVYISQILTGRRNSIIISQRESPSVMQMAKMLQEQGCKVHKLPVNSDGVVEAKTLLDYITPRTALVSIQSVDGESGAINPIEEIAEICKRYEVPFHTDATYALGKVPLNVQDLGVDYLTISGETIHAPAGVGALYIKEGNSIPPLIYGSRSHYEQYRGGPVNVAYSVGFGKAVELAVDALEFEMEDAKELRDELEEALREIDGVTPLIPWSLRVPNTLLVSVEGIHSEQLLYELNRVGIGAYSHTIYPFGDWEKKSIIEALGMDSSLKHTTVGFALSRNTTKEEIDYTIKNIKEIISYLKEFSACTTKESK